MNALQIAKKVYRKCGLHGTLDYFETPTGPQQVATVEAVQDAWTHLQTLRSKWTFMDSFTTFATVSGTSTYATSAIMSGASEDDLDYILPGGLIYDKRPMPKLDWRAYHYVDNTVPGTLAWYSWDDATSTLYLSQPNDAYTLTVRYHRLPQSLTSGTDVPRLPTKFHNLIVYEALQSMAVFLGNDEVGTRYATQYDEMLGELMRGYIPTETVYVPRGFL